MSWETTCRIAPPLLARCLRAHQSSRHSTALSVTSTPDETVNHAS
jgi:hypothetical protein